MAYLSLNSIAISSVFNMGQIGIHGPHWKLLVHYLKLVWLPGSFG